MQTQPLRGVNIAVNVQSRNVSSIAKTQTFGPGLQADVHKSPAEASGPEQVGVTPQIKMEIFHVTSSILLPTPESGYMEQCPSDLHHQLNLKPQICI